MFINLQLPITRGHDCLSIGKFCNSMGQVALIVSLYDPKLLIIWEIYEKVFVHTSLNTESLHSDPIEAIYWAR